MLHRKIPYYLLILICCFHLFGCNGDSDSNIQYEKSFVEIRSKAEAENKPFCIVLVDSSKTMTVRYIENIVNTYPALSKKVLFNIVDITKSSNRWFEQWLSPIYIPMACVFIPSGQLIDVIPGISHEGFSYMEETIKSSSVSSNMPCRNRFDLGKVAYVEFMDAILQAKMNVDAGRDATSDIEKTLEIFEYPFNLGLKLQTQLLLCDTLAARETAEKLISNSTAYTLLNYSDQYQLARRTIDPNYNVITEPYLELQPTTMTLEECTFGDTVNFDITIKNTGSQDVVVYDVVTSCSCLDFNGEKDFTLRPGDSIPVSFVFIAENTGKLVRGGYFMSNARNPVAEFTLSVTVRK